MPETKKEHWDIALALVIGLVLTTVGMMSLSGILALPSSVSAATETETVIVSATVSPWLSFAVTPTTTSITPDLVTSAGGLNIGESDYIRITAGTNASGGYSLDIKSANASLDYGATDTIVSASATLVAGADGYGAQGVTSDGDVTIGAWYDFATSTNQVGALETTDRDLADTTGETSDDITWLTLKATATSTKAVGTYTDTLTLTLVGT